MTRSGVDLALAYWLAQREATAHRRAGRAIPERLRTHLRALEALLESEDGPPAPPIRGSWEPSGLTLLTAEQASAALDVTPRQARRLGHRIGGRRIGGRWLFDRDAVTEHRDGRTTNP
ncbi:hypothetical protein [Nocardia sp. MW-W600-9]